jgi:hypothetical protein
VTLGRWPGRPLVTRTKGSRGANGSPETTNGRIRAPWDDPRGRDELGTRHGRARTRSRRAWIERQTVRRSSRPPENTEEVEVCRFRGTMGRAGRGTARRTGRGTGLRDVARPHGRCDAASTARTAAAAQAEPLHDYANGMYSHTVMTAILPGFGSVARQLPARSIARL